jgi:cyclopropane-fatty-acyl-phospholipid synthase
VEPRDAQSAPHVSRAGARTQPESGASAAAIAFHYDVGRAFYRLWLDESLTYSGAMWRAGDSLWSAQQRKLDYHVDQAGAADAKRVLDIGCGWGSLLRRLHERYGVPELTGLTLSQDQARAVREWAPEGVQVRLESYAEHVPEQPYDAAISIGAFEHFARRELTDDARVQAYREFFAHCREWLRPGAKLSLQTIAYDNYERGVSNEFLSRDIFPESQLPRLDEIARASEGLFSIVALRNDARDYERTVSAWRSALCAQRAAAAALVGEEVVARYDTYLQLAQVGFHLGTMALLRVTLRRNDAVRSKFLPGSAR